ncbi:hypothetical protein PENSPDRAFT_694600 [Peniophora sp. CONT]|nr:hypothetical protein PENSPDRAFT_694600 [Peniophora sp. CONT]
MHWVIRENARTSPHVPTATQLAAAASFAKDRLIRTLRMQLATAAQGPAAALSFSGVPTKEGIYKRAPRDFIFSIALYIQHQQYEMNENFADDRKIRIFAGFLEQGADRWYNQLVVEHDRQAQGPLAYHGPLRSMDALADKFLNDYKDVNICATAKHYEPSLTR